MKTTLKAALLISSALVATPVLAQQEPIPPEHYTLDARGVDLTSGAYVYPGKSISIGSPATGGLEHSLAYIYDGEGLVSGWRDTLAGGIRLRGTSTYVVSIGLRSWSFEKSGSTFVPSAARGQTLTQPTSTTYRFTDAEGNVADFGLTDSHATPLNLVDIKTYRRPNGEVRKYSYSTIRYCREFTQGVHSCDSEINYDYATRLNWVENNYGYQIHYKYVTDTIDDEDSGRDSVLWRSLKTATALNNGCCQLNRLRPKSAQPAPIRRPLPPKRRSLRRGSGEG